MSRQIIASPGREPREASQTARTTQQSSHTPQSILNTPSTSNQYRSPRPATAMILPQADELPLFDSYTEEDAEVRLHSPKPPQYPNTFLPGVAVVKNFPSRPRWTGRNTGTRKTKPCGTTNRSPRMMRLVITKTRNTVKSDPSLDATRITTSARHMHGMMAFPGSSQTLERLDCRYAASQATTLSRGTPDTPLGKQARSNPGMATSICRSRLDRRCP
jgi:hypothetical protein